MEGRPLKIKSYDGATIHAAVFDPEGAPKGIIVICHGFGESSGGYRELARFFAEHGFASIIHDQRGHGQSALRHKRTGRPVWGVIPSYESFLNDIDAVLKEAASHCPGAPVVLYGHSMGGNIAVNYLLKRDQKVFTCAILESPWLRLFKPLSSFTVKLANLLGRISPRLAITNKLDEGLVVSDPDRRAIFQDADAFYHNRISFRMVSGISEAGEYAINNADKLTIPVYLAYAEADKIVCNKAIKALDQASGDNVELKMYNHHHAIHNDLDRERFYGDMLAFIERCLKADET